MTECVAELIGQDFECSDITLLTMLGYRKSVLSDRMRVGDWKIRRFAGHYDDHNEEIMSDGEIYFESIYRFKGQESKAVILCDIDPNPERQMDWERRLYCGMTRTTMCLVLLARDSNPFSKRLIEAVAGK